jgi:hypothetical protein
MPINREACFAALFQRLQAVPGFKFTSRVFQSWDDTMPPQCPAMFMVKDFERTVAAAQGMPPLFVLTARVVMYARNDEGRLVPPSTQLNDLLDGIDAAIKRTPEEGPVAGANFLNNPPGTWGTSLGGLCYTCQRQGEVMIFEGIIGSDAQAVVKIDILISA